MKSIGIVILATAITAVLTGSAQAAFVWPQTGRVTSNFYSKRSYGNHGAIDIAGPNGSAVGSAYAGRVTFRGWSGGYGNLVIVSHVSGYSTYYAHLSRYGATGNVGQGATIGYEGSTGNSTGPHVHFEIRRYGAKKYVPATVGSTLRKGAAVPYNYPR